MAMRRVIGSFHRLGLPCRPAMLHGGSVGEAEVKNSSKLKSESGMPADGEEVVACWSEDEASYSEAVVRATGARASTEGWMEACATPSVMQRCPLFTRFLRPAMTPNTLRARRTGQS